MRFKVAPKADVPADVVAEIARLGQVTRIGRAAVAAAILTLGARALAGRDSLAVGPSVRFVYQAGGDGRDDEVETGIAAIAELTGLDREDIVEHALRAYVRSAKRTGNVTLEHVSEPEDGTGADDVLTPWQRSVLARLCVSEGLSGIRATFGPKDCTRATGARPRKGRAFLLPRCQRLHYHRGCFLKVNCPQSRAYRAHFVVIRAKQSAKFRHASRRSRLRASQTSPEINPGTDV